MTVLLERAWLEECARLWARRRVLYVGVRCPLRETLRRERERTDRTIGQAAAQHAVVHHWGGYDLEVDTSELSADEAAARIGATVASGFPERPLAHLGS